MLPPPFSCSKISQLNLYKLVLFGKSQTPSLGNATGQERRSPFLSLIWESFSEVGALVMVGKEALPSYLVEFKHCLPDTAVAPDKGNETVKKLGA